MVSFWKCCFYVIFSYTISFKKGGVTIWVLFLVIFHWHGFDKALKCNISIYSNWYLWDLGSLFQSVIANLQYSILAYEVTTEMISHTPTQFCVVKLPERSLPGTAAGASCSQEKTQSHMGQKWMTQLYVSGVLTSFFWSHQAELFFCKYPRCMCACWTDASSGETVWQLNRSDTHLYLCDNIVALTS